jgi:flagellar hook-length control protein FliK
MFELHVKSILIAADAQAAQPPAGGEAAAPDFAALLAGRLGAARAQAAANDAGAPLAGANAAADPAAAGASSTAWRGGTEDADAAGDGDAAAAGRGDSAAGLESQLLASLGLPAPQPAPRAASGGQDSAGAVAPDRRGPSVRAAQRADQQAAEQGPAASAFERAAAEPRTSLPAASGPDPATAAAADPAPPAAAPSHAGAQDAQPAAAARAVATLPGQPGSPQWREALGASVALFASRNVQSAELNIHPAELGPVQVSIRIESNEASIALSAAHPDTRLALENALPRLRELLEAQGLAVGQASVGDPGASGREQAARDHRAAARGADAQETVAQTRTTKRNGLVDIFA